MIDQGFRLVALCSRRVCGGSVGSVALAAAAGDLWGDVLGLVSGVRWLPVSTGDDLGCGPLVPAVRAVLPGTSRSYKWANSPIPAQVSWRAWPVAGIRGSSPPVPSTSSWRRRDADRAAGHLTHHPHPVTGVGEVRARDVGQDHRRRGPAVLRHPRRQRHHHVRKSHAVHRATGQRHAHLLTAIEAST
jgi:hypothetical protein